MLRLSVFGYAHVGNWEPYVGDGSQTEYGFEIHGGWDYHALSVPDWSNTLPAG